MNKKSKLLDQTQASRVFKLPLNVFLDLIDKNEISLQCTKIEKDIKYFCKEDVIKECEKYQRALVIPEGCITTAEAAEILGILPTSVVATSKRKNTFPVAGTIKFGTFKGRAKNYYRLDDILEYKKIRDTKQPTKQKKLSNNYELPVTHKCHDCGKPTPNYRCPDCWRKIRGYAYASSQEPVYSYD